MWGMQRKTNNMNDQWMTPHSLVCW
jgi:hypothetical protein